MDKLIEENELFPFPIHLVEVFSKLGALLFQNNSDLNLKDQFIFLSILIEKKGLNTNEFKFVNLL